MNTPSGTPFSVVKSEYWWLRTVKRLGRLRAAYLALRIWW